MSVEAAKEIEQRIKSAENQGAQILCGGERENAIIAPTIIENVTDEMDLIKEETFGPVVPLLPFPQQMISLDK